MSEAGEELLYDFLNGVPTFKDLWLEMRGKTLQTMFND